MSIDIHNKSVKEKIKKYGMLINSIVLIGEVGWGGDARPEETHRLLTGGKLNETRW